MIYQMMFPKQAQPLPFLKKLCFYNLAFIALLLLQLLKSHLKFAISLSANRQTQILVFSFLSLCSLDHDHGLLYKWQSELSQLISLLKAQLQFAILSVIFAHFGCQLKFNSLGKNELELASTQKSSKGQMLSHHRKEESTLWLQLEDMF